MQIYRRVISALLFLLISYASFAGDIADLKSVDFAGRKPKIGFFIGSYDPPHLHHQQIIEMAQKMGGLDYVLVIPNDTAFHKPMVSKIDHRINMLDLIFRNNEKILIPMDRNEFQFPLLKSIRKFISENIPEYEAVGIMGKDSAVRTNARLAAFVAGFDSWIVLEAEEVVGVVPEKLGGKPARVVKIELSGEFPAAHSSSIRKFMLNNPTASFPGKKKLGIDKSIYEYAQRYKLYSTPHTFMGKVKGILNCIKMAGKFPIF